MSCHFLWMSPKLCSCKLLYLSLSQAQNEHSKISSELVAASKITIVFTVTYKQRPFMFLFFSVSNGWWIELVMLPVLYVCWEMTSPDDYVSCSRSQTRALCFHPLESLKQKHCLFVWRCCSIIFYTSKLGWWILPLENALPDGAIMCAVTSPVIVFQYNFMKKFAASLFLPQATVPAFFFFFYSQVHHWNKCLVALRVKLNDSYFKYSL